MEDSRIIELYWLRDESAVAESERKYGSYCRTLAENILHDRRDAEECVSDTWLRAWNAIPPESPGNLKLFFARIARNLAFDRYEARSAAKRGGGETALVLDELAECVPSADGTEASFDAEELARCVRDFARSLPDRERNIFVKRYFYTETVKKIAKRYALTAGNVSVMLSRIRKKLRVELERKGYLNG